MKLSISEDSVLMGQKAADAAEKIILDAVEKQGYARLLLSTGQSQFAFFEAFVKKNIPWDKLEIFHLDEYVDLPLSHPASFRKYLKERFMDRICGGTMHYIDGEADTGKTIETYTSAIREKPIDLGMIGIGENGHIAFNDPPADFGTKEAYHVVALDEKCRRQQVGEGWFAAVEDVPKYAISATVPMILSCRHIISVVPHSVKADAVQKTLETEGETPMIPATAMKKHESWRLYLDRDSAEKLSQKLEV